MHVTKQLLSYNDIARILYLDFISLVIFLQTTSKFVNKRACLHQLNNRGYLHVIL